MKKPTTLTQLVGELHQIIAEHGDKRVVSIGTTSDGHYTFWLADMQYRFEDGLSETTTHNVNCYQD